MGMTLSEKILAEHSGKKCVRPGEFVFAEVDICLGNDVTAPLAIEQFEKAGLKELFDPRRICLVPDHFTPNKDIHAAELARRMRQFVRKHGISHYFEVGRVGIEHVHQEPAGSGELGGKRPIATADLHTQAASDAAALEDSVCHRAGLSRLPDRGTDDEREKQRQPGDANCSHHYSAP